MIREDELAAMTGRDKESVLIRKTGRYIVVAISADPDMGPEQSMNRCMVVLEQLALELSSQ